MTVTPSDLVLLMHRLNAVECVVEQLVDTVEQMKNVVTEEIDRDKAALGGYTTISAQELHQRGYTYVPGPSSFGGAIKPSGTHPPPDNNPQWGQLLPPSDTAPFFERLFGKKKEIITYDDPND